MIRRQPALLAIVALSACFVLGMAETVAPDPHNPLGLLAAQVASVLTPAPSLLRAGTERATMTAMLYTHAHLALIVAFAAAVCLLPVARRPRRPTGALALIGVQIALAGVCSSSLSFVATALMPAVLPLPMAWVTLAVQSLLRVAVALWMLLWAGPVLGDALVGRALLLVAAELGVNLLAFGVSYLVVRERRARVALAGAHAELLATQTLLAATVRGAERMRIARDLHDIVGHHLTALNLHLDLALRQSSHDAPPALRTSHALAKNLLAEVRVVVAQERDAETVDLRAVLATLCAGIPEPEVTLVYDDDVVIASQAVAHALFCCVQEGLSNGVRHAQASRITVQLARRDDALLLTIDDDGRGSTGAAAGNGLRGMRERVDALGGTLTAANRATGGYGLAIGLPLAGDAA